MSVATSPSIGCGKSQHGPDRWLGNADFGVVTSPSAFGLFVNGKIRAASKLAEQLQPISSSSYN